MTGVSRDYRTNPMALGASIRDAEGLVGRPGTAEREDRATSARRSRRPFAVATVGLPRGFEPSASGRRSYFRSYTCRYWLPVSTPARRDSHCSCYLRSTSFRCSPATRIVTNNLSARRGTVSENRAPKQFSIGRRSRSGVQVVSRRPCVRRGSRSAVRSADRRGDTPPGGAPPGERVAGAHTRSRSDPEASTPPRRARRRGGVLTSR